MKCSRCKNKILYNRYKTIEGEVYCPNCNPPLKGIVIHKERLKEFAEELFESPEKEDEIRNDTEVETDLDKLKKEKKPRKRKKSKKVTKNGM